MAHAKVYSQFFERLELQLRKEMAMWDYTETRVVNNFAQHHQYNITAEARLACGLKVSVICDSLFPTQPPKVVCQGSYKGTYIDPVTKDISYDNFFQWTKTCSISKLLAEIDRFYFKDKPSINEENQELVHEIEKMKNIIRQDMLNIDRNQLMLIIDPLEQLMLRDPAFKKELILRSTEANIAKKRISSLIDKVAERAGKINRGTTRECRHDRLNARVGFISTGTLQDRS
jgi:hypothetical protein